MAIRYAVPQVQTCWPLVAAAIDGLERLDLVPMASVADQRRHVDMLAACGVDYVETRPLELAIEMLGRCESLRGEEWLRQRYAERVVPRRKPPPVIDLQIRVEKAVNARKINIETLQDRNGFRVSVVTTQGEVVVCTGDKLRWVLDGALAMASSGIAA